MFVIAGLVTKGKSVFFCLKIFLTFTNSVDSGEMQHYTAFYLSFHCLQIYSFRGFSNTKGLFVKFQANMQVNL